MKINKIQKFAFLSVCISCLASFSFFSQTLALNKEDSYENNQESPDSNFVAKLQSAYTHGFLFLKAFAQAYGLSVPNFDDTSYVDADLESKKVESLISLIENNIPDFKLLVHYLRSSHNDNSEENRSSAHKILLSLPNGAKLVELFDKAYYPRINIYFEELYGSFKKSYSKGYAEYFGTQSADEAVKAIEDRLVKLENELLYNFSYDKFKEIKQELAKLPNGTKLIQLFSDYVEKDIKPYINEIKFEDMLLRYMYPNIPDHIESMSELERFWMRDSASALERFWISDAARRPYSERAKLILAKLDKTGELNKLYDGLFR